MITLLSHIFIKDRTSYNDENVRRKYGILTGMVGIFLNLFLFATKFTAGIITSSISVTADAFNNLSDAGSSIITLLGFKLSGQKPDNEHPFGHGRIEYISGLFVSVIILIVAFELIKSGVIKIFKPEEVTANVFTFVFLVLSIIIKLYMFTYNIIISKKISSTSMKATAVDSISDTLATSVVLICYILQSAFGIKIDAYAGIGVGLFIAYAGIKTLSETVSPLLGQKPDPEFVKKIEEIVKSKECVIGIHDLIVHDYGPTRIFVSLHAEVPCDKDILYLHEIIDDIEGEIKKELKCEVSIHMDPVDTNDESLYEAKVMVTSILHKIDERLNLHDFRMVHGENHSNLIFDVVIPHKFKMSEKELYDEIQEKVHSKHKGYYCVINFDNDYTGITE
ncbi:MAG: cation diffusion facilitator family transporter [Lachnospiraceae bacterium]|nr:cation diffusion facilitator family transporter [Lachnospiraceae bacterium]